MRSIVSGHTHYTNHNFCRKKDSLFTTKISLLSSSRLISGSPIEKQPVFSSSLTREVVFVMYHLVKKIEATLQVKSELMLVRDIYCDNRSHWKQRNCGDLCSAI
jgi:hypothetical protein